MSVVADYKDERGQWRKNSPTVRGVKTKTVCGRLWDNMNTRCSASFQERFPHYKGCYMADSFKDFQFFVEWCHSQEGFGLVDYELDKDILVARNKCYSENTCVFVPNNLNMFFTNRGNPKGSSFVPLSQRYVASLKVDGKNTYIGSFTSQDDAQKAYTAAKLDYLRVWLQRLKDRVFKVEQRVIDRIAVMTQ